MPPAGTAIPTYDARGNLTGQGTSSFTYSSENLLKSATLSSGASTLRYDPAMRLAQTSGSATTRFLYDGTDLVAEYDGAATVVLRRYVHGPGTDEPLVWYEGSGTSDRRWLHADERGSIIAVTNGSGASIGTNAYDEWGNPQSGNLGRFGYTGQTWLPEIGLWYYKARMYNPRLGRFMQTDPIGYGDGMNLYAYVGGDPVNRGDPSGLATIAFESCRTLTGIGTYSADGGAIPDGGAIDGSAIVVTGTKEKCSLEYAYIPDSFYEQPQPRPAPLRNAPPGKGQVQKTDAQDSPSNSNDVCGSPGNSQYVPEGMATTSFRGPCLKHDECYGTIGKTQEQCDQSLGRDILENCKSSGGWLCALSSYVYYRALAGIPGIISPGKAAFDNAQRTARLRVGGRP